MRSIKKIALISALGGCLAVSAGGHASPLSGLTPSNEKPTLVREVEGKTSDGTYIVTLNEPAVAMYKGGIAGFEATNAKANGKKRLDTKSQRAQKYQQHLKDRQAAVLSEAQSVIGRGLKTRFNYQHAVNGFAVELSVKEAKLMERVKGVRSVQRERIEYPTTEAGPEWIKAHKIWQNGASSSRGEGMVVAVLDTGINSDHPSFAATGDDGYSAQNPLGSGNYLPGSYCDAVDPNFCNDKLIGAWDMVASDGVIPEDNDGHGSHTASTTAGNVVNGARLETPTTSAEFDISGVAPHANIIAYDVCDDGCPGASLLAAVDQVLIDAGNLPQGIAALNYSISGGGDPYNDPIELGFLAAVEAGIYVAASAGNSGPTASTVAHLGPWVSTTAASTHKRKITNTLIGLNSDGGGLADLNGASFSAGFGPAPIIHANTIGSDPTGQCLTPFPPGTFSGEIVMCDRGTIARTEKGQNVLAGGAGGYILGNLGQGESTSADAHFLPAIHLGDTAAAALKAWLAANTNTVGTITPSNVEYAKANADIMADFSSRGPQLAFDVLKPDVTAPGVDIFAATANGASISTPEYEFLSGTSMSSPHNAGAGTLMRAIHPDLTPTEIKSAMMLTATNEDTVKEDGVTPTDPFDLGSGRIRLDRAKWTDIVMSETGDNFMSADPSIGGDPSALNLASMMNSNCVGTCSWTRTVTSAAEKARNWMVSANAMGFDVELNLDSTEGKVITPVPGQEDTIGFKLRPGQSATFTVTVNNVQSSEGWQHGEIMMSRGKRVRSGPKQRRRYMPMSVFASKASDDTLFTKTVDSDTVANGDSLVYELSVTNGNLSGPITVTDVLPDGVTFVAASETENVVGGSTTSAFAYDAGSNSVSWTGELDNSGMNVVSNAGPFTGYFKLAPGADVGIPSGCDEGGWIFTVPSFTHNGQSYTQAIMSVNGTLEAGTDSGQSAGYINQELPDAAVPNNILAPYWADLNACLGGTMSVGQVNGGGSDSWMVFEWDSIPYWTPDDSTVDRASFKVWVLLDSSTTPYPPAHFTYGRLDNTTFATVGAENANGTVGDSYYFDGAGAAPVVGEDILVIPVAGGSATLGFEVDADCSAGDVIVNRADVNDADISETAIAVTECVDAP